MGIGGASESVKRPHLPVEALLDEVSGEHTAG